MQRRTYWFSGRVQGVGFRYTAKNIAMRYDVRGYVRNLPDGRVELVIEGDPVRMDQIVEQVRRKMDGFIDKSEMVAAEATGEFQQFSIRH